ncbi:MAG: aminodeoxychorismate synthase component I [Sterolibacterium sp.]
MQPLFVFDFPLAGGVRRPLAFGTPREILCATAPAEVRGVLRAVESRARSGAWVAGCVSYEAAPAFDAALRVRPGGDFPLAWFGVFDAPLPAGAEDPFYLAPGTGQWQPSVSRAGFDADIAAIRKAIFAGEVYQVNYTLRLHSRHAGSELAWFRQLREAQPNAYAAYLNLGRWRILSVSPELFFRRDGHRLTAMPMKGTAQRGRWPAEDRQIAESLGASDKNRAENLMIVDLLRNDLSRLAMPHSVRVPALFSIERYPTVMQMTSTITAEARPDVALDDIFGALFPCGSVTGAPKVKAMEIIARLETEPRGIYCGAIGLLRPGGDAMFNVAIRSVTLDGTDATATCGIGSGIVWDSCAADEYAETLLKSQFLCDAANDFQLLETLRLEGGRYVRLERHLARLAASARHFCRPFDAARCRERLDSVAAEAGRQDARMRIRLDRRGNIAVAIDPLPEPVEQPAVFAVAATPVARDSLWLYHKTTRREVYERAAAAHPEAFDVLLWNEQGELTEFTRGNLVLELDGRQLTPPIASGLLDGCLRSEMLDNGEITEAVLNLDDLARAQRVWFVNSLRGRIEVRRALPSNMAA